MKLPLIIDANVTFNESQSSNAYQIRVRQHFKCNKLRLKMSLMKNNHITIDFYVSVNE